MDIQCHIDKLILCYSPTLQVTHVRGHQDTKKHSSLTWLETLNVKSDVLATKARYNHPELSVLQQQLWFPESRIQL